MSHFVKLEKKKFKYDYFAIVFCDLIQPFHRCKYHSSPRSLVLAIDGSVECFVGWRRKHFDHMGFVAMHRWRMENKFSV